MLSHETKHIILKSNALNLLSSENDPHAFKCVIILGGWDKFKSRISFQDFNITKNHYEFGYRVLRNHFQVIITDGKIRVKNMATNKDFIKIERKDVIKNDLKYLFASSGKWGGRGHIQVLQSSKTIKTYHIPDVKNADQLIFDNMNEIDAIDVFAPGFTNNIHFVLRIVSL